MRRLDVEVYEPGDTIGTLSADGVVRMWTVNAEGEPVRSDTRLLGNTTSFTLATPIEDLDLTVRTYNVLKREDINTVADMLAAWDEGVEHLMGLRNLGQKGIDEISSWVGRLRPLTGT